MCVGSLASLHSADEPQEGRNSCPLLRSCFIGSCHVGVSKRFSRSISLAVYCHCSDNWLDTWQNVVKFIFMIVRSTECRNHINSENNNEFQMGFEPTTLRDLAGRSNHWATGDSMVSNGEMWAFGCNRIARSHSQMLTWSRGTWKHIKTREFGT